MERAHTLPRLFLSPVSVSDVELIATGAVSPLTGFMGKADYDSVVDTMHLANGLVWTIPIALPVSRAFADSLKEGAEIALATGHGGEIVSGQMCSIHSTLILRR